MIKGKHAFAFRCMYNDQHKIASVYLVTALTLTEAKIKLKNMPGHSHFRNKGSECHGSYEFMHRNTPNGR